MYTDWTIPSKQRQLHPNVPTQIDTFRFNLHRCKMKWNLNLIDHNLYFYMKLPGHVDGVVGSKSDEEHIHFHCRYLRLICKLHT